MASTIRPFTGSIRPVALLLLALAVLFSAGLGCRAVAAVPVSAPAAHGHCDQPGERPDKPAPQAMACAVACAAIPQAASVGAALKVAPQAQPSTLQPVLTAGPAHGPAPPPPRVA